MKYEEPNIELILICEDIITSSPGDLELGDESGDIIDADKLQ